MYFPSMVCKSDITMSNNMIYAKSNFLTRCPAPLTSAKPAFRRPPLVTFRCIKNQENTPTRGWLAPLELETPVGKLLSDALLEDQSSFLVKARKELAHLAAERDEDEARLKLSLGVDDDCLFRRMAETKRCGRQEAVEEILYTLIVYKFSEIKFPLIPPLSELPNKSLELILPLNDVEFESFYHSEVLELVKKKLDDMFLKLLYDVTDNACAPTDTPDIDLYLQYIELVKFGYFLKSTFFRYQLELRLKESGSDGMRFRGYLDKMTCMCKEQRSKEVIRLGHKHAMALLSGYSEEINMSYANVMRFLQEAVAFGSFLWEMETWVDALYPLEDTI